MPSSEPAASARSTIWQAGAAGPASSGGGLAAAVPALPPFLAASAPGLSSPPLPAGTGAARRHVQTRGERPGIGHALEFRLPAEFGRAGFMADAQVRDPQLRAIAPRREGGLQVAQRHRQRRAILQ
jgi:hypothetical protein